MATIASPTPITTTYDNLHRRPSSRQIARTAANRPQLRRNSPLTASSAAVNDLAPSAVIAYHTGDSSDDDVPVPIKFSAAVKALLGEEASSIDTSPVVSHDRRTTTEYEGAEPRRLSGHLQRIQSRAASPQWSSNGSPAPRVVRVGPVSRPTSKLLERDGSFQYHNIGRTSELAEATPDLITPAPRPRSIRVNGTRLGSRSPQDLEQSAEGNESSGRSPLMANVRSQLDGQQDNSSAERMAQLGTGTVTRSRNGDDALQSTMRIKRVGKMSGSYLNGPVRRGMIRRQSEEDDVPQFGGEDQAEPEGASPRLLAGGSRHGSPIGYNKSTTNDLISVSGPPEPESNHVSFASRETVVQPYGRPEEHTAASPHATSAKARATPASGGSLSSSRSSSTRVQPVFKVPPLPPMPSQHDQENEPPPTFKRTKPASGMLDKIGKIKILQDQKENQATPVTVSPARKPLAARSSNTPHRAPPPPPKMSVLETATATAGAAATSSQSRKKRNHITVNSKIFTRLDCIGRGGTSRVYRVMAENYKIFALKRVGLENADPVSMAGYKGEIDLLRKFENNDRVVQLFDYEINEEKQTLSVLMEVGESDLFRVLNQRLKTENAKLDLSFTRYYWKEMLECVQAVHKEDVVHSDLKPANFLLVQGRLKLIDFGIANAIADDTVNVHREQQIGTPNYMSPEHLVDCNAVGGLPSSAGRLLKLGKPSDVWSLGCILYQMIYGQPPFAHIQKQFERMMSIPNPRVVIEYPPTGVGGVSVPSSVIRTLRRCLQREQMLRPTIEELLSPNNEFLNPDSSNPNHTSTTTNGQAQFGKSSSTTTASSSSTVPLSQEMLSRILHNVMNHCKYNGIPPDAELSRWPEAFFVKIRQAVEEEEKENEKEKIR